MKPPSRPCVDLLLKCCPTLFFVAGMARNSRASSTWTWTGPDNAVWSNTNYWTRTGDGAHGLPATGTNVLASLNGYSDHTFQLQSSSDLSLANFASIVPAQSGGTGSTLTFPDSNASSPQQFYRVLVNP
jgi:hypothetical protein